MRITSLLRVFAVSALVALVAGCGSDKSSTDATPEITTTTVVWDLPPVDSLSVVDPNQPDETVSGEGQPEGDEAAAAEAADVEVADDAKEVTIDPCTLVTAEEWTRFAGAGGVSSKPLEDGDACGFVNAADDLRLAIAALKRGSATPWLTDEQRAKGSPATVNGADKSTWITAFPIPASSTLVAEAKGYDVVVEISSRGTKSPEQVKEAAIGFATSTMTRLP